MHVRTKKFSVASVNEDPGKNNAANPDDDATEVEWSGLHHKLLLSDELVEKCL